MRLNTDAPVNEVEVVPRDVDGSVHHAALDEATYNPEHVPTAPVHTERMCVCACLCVCVSVCASMCLCVSLFPCVCALTHEKSTLLTGLQPKSVLDRQNHDGRNPTQATPTCIHMHPNHT